MIPRKLFGPFAFAIVLLIGACSEPDARLEKLAANDVILAFGDSLTFGTGAPDGQSYPDMLSLLSAREVINAGVPGELSADGLTRLSDVLDNITPRLLVLCHGGNDMLRKKNLGKARQNIEAMIALAKERDIAVLLLGVPKPGIWLSTAEMYAEIAATTATPILADTIATILGDSGLKSDPVHPNAAGYRQLAEDVHEILTDLGAL
jgi:acyl-CoA thioesterase I